MEIKKNDSKNLEKKRGLFFQLGLLITGSLTLAAFTFQLPETRVDLNEKLAFRPTTLEFDLEPQEIQKKSEDASTEELATSSTVDSEQAASELIRQTGNLQQTVESGTDVNLGDLLSGLKTTIGTDLIKIELEDKIEEYPLKEAEFPGGYIALQKFIQENIDYPQAEVEMNHSDLVRVSFVIEKDGSISTISVVKGRYDLLNMEAKRLVRKFPKWKPGESKYEKVRTKVILPINFEITP